VKIKTVGLIGFGRFGAMAYQYLRKCKDLLVYDADSRKLEACPDAATLDEVSRADAILLTVPISALRDLCRQIAPKLVSGQLIIDACSVKRHPVEWMLEELPSNVQVLGTHPLFGPDSGRGGIAGLRIAVCPVRVDATVRRQVNAYLSSLGLEVIETTPEEHDLQIARTQAVFHLIAQAFKRLNWGGERITTPGPETFFNLVKTVQNDTDQLFFDLQSQNPYAHAAREEFARELERINAELRGQLDERD
jgi:prephenate dehydrogenase